LQCASDLSLVDAVEEVAVMQQETRASEARRDDLKER
jgi:hypothetical protein